MLRHTLSLLASAALLASAMTAHSAEIYSIANDGRTLIRFNSATPGVVTTVGNFSGDTVTMSGMDFRPADGALYGFNQATSGIYRIDITSGATSLVSTSTTAIGSTTMGIDFNPVPDRMRVVSTGDQNLRINVATGAAIVDGTLAFAAGDPNAGANPNIIDAAYTNHDIDPLTGTTLYYIDSVLDILVSTLNPNGGVLNTIGALGVDTSNFTGFDIFTQAGVNTAYASLTTANGVGLYTINLATGAATLIGAINGQALDGLAVAPVPEPTTLALLALGGIAAVGVRRRSTVRTAAAA